MALMPTDRTRHRGTALWCYLAALVAVPLIGVGVLTTLIAVHASGDVDSARRAEAAVRAVARLDAVRTAAEREILPTLAVAVIDDPSAATALGVSPWMLASARGLAVDGAVQARAATDAALAAVPAGSPDAAVAEHVSADLAELRAGVDRGQVRLEQLYLGYLDVSNDLMTAECAAAAAAVSEGVPARTARAVQDVETIATLAQDASRQTPLYLGSLVAPDTALIGSRLAWETGWLSYTDAQRQMEELSQESLRAAWAQLRESELMTGLDALLTPATTPSALTTDVGRLTELLYRSGDRDAALAQLVGTAVDEVLALAAADREDAAAVLRRTIELGIGLLLVSTVGAVWLGRTVSRSLGLLAGQATRISEGELVEVEARGPREVRTVSAALGAAVAGLRRIQDQARAVARGDLDDALLDQPLPGPLGEVVHASIQQIVTSVRQREELQFALAHRATHDPLTELPNRAQALTLVTSALHRARRSGEMTGLLFVDLDGFKAVNDSRGHAAGDAVLREVARRMRAAVRAGDVVCRLGGDEFVVLVEPVETERDLMDLAERLVAAVGEPVDVGGLVQVGASIGVAVSRDGGADADALFAEAGTAAERAKRHGRGRAEIFDDALRQQLASRAATEAAIAAALTNGEMRLVYQPVLDVAEQRLRGFEALVRWVRQDGVVVPPDEFIPVAESSSLVCDLDRWVLHEATRQLAAWRAGTPAVPGAAEPTVAVNVSGRHLTDRRVVADVADALAASGLPPRLLVLEVTETVLVDDPVAMTHLSELRAMGVAIAIDDFGTGYTSIGQLRHMPVDTLKIDRSFVASPDPGQQELVGLVIGAAHTFGLDVVAEGVEEPAQLERLRAQGCDLAQGYLLHRPLPPEAAGALIRPMAGAAPAS